MQHDIDHYYADYHLDIPSPLESVYSNLVQGLQSHTITVRFQYTDILRQKMQKKTGLPQTVYPCFGINHHINKQGS